MFYALVLFTTIIKTPVQGISLKRIMCYILLAQHALLRLYVNFICNLSLIHVYSSLY